MAALSTQTVTRAGLNPTFTAAAGGGDTMATGETMFLVVKNGGGAPITVTVATPGTVEGAAIADTAVSVTNAQERWIGPITRSFYGDPGTSPAYRANITYSGVTSVTVAAVSI
jgi:hypothetical protein